MPTGIAELGIPGVERAAAPAALPTTCINDLVSIDGKPFPVKVSGSVSSTMAQRPLQLTPCSDGTTITLAAGPHRIDIHVSPKTTSGLDATQLVLASTAGGTATAPSTLADYSVPTNEHAQPYA